MLNSLVISAWRALGSDDEIWYWFRVEFLKNFSLEVSGLWRRDLLLTLYWFHYEFELGALWDLMASQICCWFCIDFSKKYSPERALGSDSQNEFHEEFEHRGLRDLTARFAIGFALISLRIQAWRALGSDDQIFYWFCIDLIKKYSPESFDFVIDFIQNLILEGSGLWRPDLQLILYWYEQKKTVWAALGVPDEICYWFCIAFNKKSYWKQMREVPELSGAIFLLLSIKIIMKVEEGGSGALGSDFLIVLFIRNYNEHERGRIRSSRERCSYCFS